MSHTPTVRAFVPTLHNDTYPTIDPTKLDLSGKTVLITGASKGIGSATAISFARAGASGLILGARSSLLEVRDNVIEQAKIAGHSPPKVLALEIDVSSQKSVEDAASRVRSEFRSVDVLINNAGYLEQWSPITETDPAEWWKTWNVNILGVYLMNRYFLPLVLQSELKTIVNITSIGAHLTMHGASAYQTSKLAVLRLTEFLMEEYGSQGLIAIGAHPGGVSTELALNMPKYMHSLLNDRPELAGDFLVKLVSERREWLAGRYLSVNWDWNELMAKKEVIMDEDLLKVRLAL
ncbi:uncharacterized protein PV09_02159 [Verruconis gallopava]|uniref:Uncharacterized protein n=1 Tax=Verruconis gallopava TaxID=253628 RepID=A0A0D2B7U3_9PEZI|nr:uncharacterized protein PV09_02159 [Verruconis gallopava]KIW07309.1 hypothetical protein PV09_02159 [Verruconis gallopava]